MARIQVLHVDDDPALVELAAAMLEREDNRFSVETATSPSEGLDRLAANGFDCIISDYQMPGQNGLELLNTIREEHPDLPFILYTGKGSEEVASKAISAGVTDYLQKGTGTSQYTVLANRVTNAVEQYRSQRELEETKEKLSEMAEGTNDVLYMFNGDWSELLFINSAYETIWGGSISELKTNPRSFLDLIHPDDREKVRESMEQISNGERDVIEYRIPNSEDDEVQWIRSDTQPILDNEGNVYRIVGSTSDITENKKREKELGRVNDLFEQAQKIADFGAWETDLRNGEGWWTEQVNQIYDLPTGYEPEPGEGVEYFHPEDQPVIRNAFDQAMEAGEPYDLELRVVADEEKWVRTRAKPEVENGEVVRVRGTIQEITKRKEREAELQRERDRLDRFASVVSHDLRNPLNVATGRLDLAMEECESDHLETVGGHLEQMEILIEDVLRLARAGETVGERAPVDFAELGHRCWHNVETKSGDLKIDLDVAIKADETRLQQLVENLFRNAVKYAGDDVTVTLSKLDGGFYIEDNGPGIPETERDEVFEVGYSSRDEGTGFGLSIVKEIVEAHDWEIRVTEGADGGARFEITGVEFVAE